MFVVLFVKLLLLLRPFSLLLFGPGLALPLRVRRRSPLLLVSGDRRVLTMMMMMVMTVMKGGGITEGSSYLFAFCCRPLHTLLLLYQHFDVEQDNDNNASIYSYSTINGSDFDILYQRVESGWFTLRSGSHQILRPTYVPSVVDWLLPLDMLLCEPCMRK